MSAAPQDPDQPLDADDAAVLAELRDLHDHLDPVPDGMVDRVVHAVAWHEVQAEVARIIEHGDHLVGARGDSTTERRTMTFSGTSVSVTVMVTEQGAGRRRVDGWATAEDADDADDMDGLVVRLRHLGATQHVPVDADGRFEFGDVEAGPAQFVLEHDDQALLVTPTVDL